MALTNPNKVVTVGRLNYFKSKIDARYATVAEGQSAITELLPTSQSN